MSVSLKVVLIRSEDDLLVDRQQVYKVLKESVESHEVLGVKYIGSLLLMIRGAKYVIS